MPITSRYLAQSDPAAPIKKLSSRKALLLAGKST